MKKQIDRQAEMLKIIEDARETYANDVTDHTENEYIREGLLNANYRKTADVAREIIRDIVDPVWRAYQNSESEMTSLLAAFICECIATKIKKKYESEVADDV
jgi:hypothetical protein